MVLYAIWVFAPLNPTPTLVVVRVTYITDSHSGTEDKSLRISASSCSSTSYNHIHRYFRHWSAGLLVL